ncbi:MAG: MerR family transcriptional regulator [Lachnospiraceae bacterium]
MGIGKVHFLSGEFAQLCNISKDTLYHYEKKGIIKPDYVEENGYRYYASDQFEVVSVIVTLRDLGMSLSEIRDFISNRSEDSLLNLCIQKQIEIEAQIKNLQKMRVFFENTKKNLLEVQSIEYGKVYIQNHKQQSLLLSRKMGEDDIGDFKEIMSELIKECPMLYAFTSIGAIRTLASARAYEVDLYEYFYLSDWGERTVRTTKKAGKYLVIYHKGKYEEMLDSYKILLSYIDEHAYKVADYIYEDTIIDEFAVTTEEEFVSKIMLELID